MTTAYAAHRTLALGTAKRPHGLMAAEVDLGHVSAATTEGYAARPGGHPAAFSEPLIGMCDSARCPQCTHHFEHR